MLVPPVDKALLLKAAEAEEEVPMFLNLSVYPLLVPLNL